MGLKETGGLSYDSFRFSLTFYESNVMIAIFQKCWVKSRHDKYNPVQLKTARCLAVCRSAYILLFLTLIKKPSGTQGGE